ncbi:MULTISPECIES: ferrochelatase [unclassified Shinella]|uniref:ferrochelatase n=1 Tax=unclassified Shinella TaxID=2643062 RepID=UPI00102D39A4|nr:MULTISPECIES: ferrochelatase [unclassified Shinella]MCO5148386.1 ferrochelatase [Shinella sp.]MDC7264460.1 ferrochelatase [Shinella sp. HY16]MDC7271356.1 ferrochelatase [Shinella sp. YZ44]MDG4676258.1 ferrochelatase [Shinella sp. 838]TAA53152.1 ferrochelatase [Shinella sp. JR1-6]
MTSAKIEHSHPPVKHGKVGVLLVNLGTPDGTDYTSMRRYLKEFLMDKRVIEWPRIAWYPILFGIVLNTRPGKVGKAYETIWNKEKNESFLRTYTRSQAELMAGALKDHANVIVDWAMRYGQPSIASRMDALQKAGCERILVFPLYPQYAAATTATVNDKAFETLLKMRWQPALRTVPPYHDDPTYIDALAVSIEKHLATLDWEPEKVLTSFHGIPKSYFEKGDPYYCQCQKTARLLRERLGWSSDRLVVTFQSRFGPEEWLQPYTDKTVEKLAHEGVKRIAVLNPGFVSDCLETLEEIAEEAAESFLHNGGEKFAHIPCLNDSPEGMKVLEKIVRRELSGWVNPKAP